MSVHWSGLRSGIFQSFGNIILISQKTYRLMKNSYFFFCQNPNLEAGFKQCILNNSVPSDSSVQIPFFLAKSATLNRKWMRKHKGARYLICLGNEGSSEQWKISIYRYEFPSAPQGPLSVSCSREQNSVPTFFPSIPNFVLYKKFYCVSLAAWNYKFANLFRNFAVYISEMLETRAKLNFIPQVISQNCKVVLANCLWMHSSIARVLAFWPKLPPCKAVDGSFSMDSLEAS